MRPTRAMHATSCNTKLAFVISTIRACNTLSYTHHCHSVTSSTRAKNLALSCSSYECTGKPSSRCGSHCPPPSSTSSRSAAQSLRVVDVSQSSSEESRPPSPTLAPAPPPRMPVTPRSNLSDETARRGTLPPPPPLPAAQQEPELLREECPVAVGTLPTSPRRPHSSPELSRIEIGRPAATADAATNGTDEGPLSP